MKRLGNLKQGKWEYRFNGALFLVRDPEISSQYIGSGKTLKEAIDDAEKTRGQLLKTRNEGK